MDISFAEPLVQSRDVVQFALQCVLVLLGEEHLYVGPRGGKICSLSYNESRVHQIRQNSVVHREQSPASGTPLVTLQIRSNHCTRLLNDPINMCILHVYSNILKIIWIKFESNPNLVGNTIS